MTTTAGDKTEPQAAEGKKNWTGKRFVRRARRWAELQQRRQFNRNGKDDSTNHQEHGYSRHQPPPQHHQVFDFVEMATMGSGMWIVDEEEQKCTLVPIGDETAASTPSYQRSNLGPRRSYPCTLLHPRRQEMVVYPTEYQSSQTQQQPQQNNHQNRKQKKRQFFRTNSDAPMYYQEFVPSGAHVSIYHTEPELTILPRTNPGLQWDRRSRESSSDSDKVLSLITSDLSAASISSPNSSPPLSTSVSSQDSINHEDFFLYPTSSPLFKPKSHSNIPRFYFSKPLYVPPDLMINTQAPPERTWVMIRNPVADRPIACFTVLCYNVLCDKYATLNQYSYCTSWALNWEYRKSLIIKEIRTYEADIITLQEVETEQFATLFKVELKQLGYDGIFTPKSRARTMGEEEKKYVDGCAIFWKSEKFELDKQHVIEFTALAMNRASHSENMLNRVMPRDNVALCAVLKIKENVYATRLDRNGRQLQIPSADNVVGNPLVVCTAHVHWDPEFCDVKLVQSMMLSHEVSKLVDDVAKRYSMTVQQCPTLICGDLNSLPDSGVFEFLSRSQISRKHLDLKQFRDDPILEKFTSSPADKNVFSHALRLDSAIDPSTVPFTNYTLDFKGMIDYIFSTPQSLARLGVLGPFDPMWITNNKILGFPHPHVPSDHIPIMAQYAIIPASHQRVAAPAQQHLQHSAGVIGGGMPNAASSQSHSFIR